MGRQGGAPACGSAHGPLPQPPGCFPPAVGSVPVKTQQTLREPLQSSDGFLSGRLPALQSSVLSPPGPGPS